MYWTVAVASPRKTRTAVDNLKEQGFECYAPRYRYRRRFRGKRVWRIDFLFGRYVFVNTDEDWFGIRDVRDVSRVLLVDEKPSRVPDSWVVNMRGQEIKGFIELPKHRFKLGQLVRIERGRFAGFTGLYHGLSRRQREIVLLDAVGRVELAYGDI